jgi:hypothetical protein
MNAIRIHEPTGISGLVYEEAPDATPGLDDVLVKVAACGITHNELDWPIWTCRAGHRRLLAPRLRTSPNHSASSGLERGVRAERRLGARGLGRWMAGRLHFHVPVIPRSSGDGLTPPWKPSQPPESQLAATLARLK